MTTSSSVLIAAVCALIVIVILMIFLIVRKRRGFTDAAEYINEQIYVGNLPYRANEDDLRDYFNRFGTIDSVRVIRNFKTGRSKGYAFVTYLDSAEANAALVSHGKDMQGRTMVVRIAKPRQAQD